jgi:hypothetical protein
LSEEAAADQKLQRRLDRQRRLELQILGIDSLRLKFAVFRRQEVKAESRIFADGEI